jgi:hypothetical protein
VQIPSEEPGEASVALVDLEASEVRVPAVSGTNLQAQNKADKEACPEEALVSKTFLKISRISLVWEGIKEAGVVAKDKLKVKMWV